MLGDNAPSTSVTQDKKAQAQANAAKLFAALTTEKSANDIPVLTPTQAQHLDKWGARHLAFYLKTQNGKTRYDYDSLSAFTTALESNGTIAKHDPKKQSASSIARAYLKKLVKQGTIEMITPALK